MIGNAKIILYRIFIVYNIQLSGTSQIKIGIFFDSEYLIPIDFLLGFSDSERFCSFPKIIKLLLFKYGKAT